MNTSFLITSFKEALLTLPRKPFYDTIVIQRNGGRFLVTVYDEINVSASKVNVSSTRWRC
jgi:hypothetical protein